MRSTLDERYATQTKALDAAFLAQQTAMQTAFTAADKAVQAALESAEKAVTKAENAAEKRFEGVNEFRAQLNDQASTFIARNEYSAQYKAISDKLDTVSARNADDIAKLASRLDLSQGSNAGEKETKASHFITNGQTIAIISVVVAIISVVSVAVLAFVVHN